MFSTLEIYVPWIIIIMSHRKILNDRSPRIKSCGRLSEISSHMLYSHKLSTLFLCLRFDRTLWISLGDKSGKSYAVLHPKFYDCDN